MRRAGTRYLFVGRLFERRPSYHLLGVLLFLQLGISAASWALANLTQQLSGAAAPAGGSPVSDGVLERANPNVAVHTGKALRAAVVWRVRNLALQRCVSRVEGIKGMGCARCMTLGGPVLAPPAVRDVTSTFAQRSLHPLKRQTRRPAQQHLQYSSVDVCRRSRAVGVQRSNRQKQQVPGFWQASPAGWQTRLCPYTARRQG